MQNRTWATLHPFFEGGDILGRGVANEGFVTALLRAAPYDAFHFFLPDQSRVRHMQDRLAALFPDLCRTGTVRVFTRHALPERLAAHEHHVFHLSDCIADSAPLMRLRNALARNIFPVTGVTHSLSYARYAASFFDQIWPGVTARDAIIATSKAGMGAVAAMFAALRKGYGLTGEEWRSPNLAHIPLGIDPADFPAPEEKAEGSARARGKLGIKNTDLLLLVFARISHYSKMDVLPLLRALVRAESMGLPRGGYVVTLAGWADANSDIPQTWAALAAKLGIRFQCVPSPDSAARKDLFAAADIFLSPVDNPQETFGLTLLEAGASSLPVIASDYDGYRDLVVPGETGLLVPTLGSDISAESDALSGVWFDNQHHLQIAQQTVVDVPALARAIASLAADANLRARMGAAARARVLAGYTWPGVIKRYCALWDELAAAPADKPPAAHPLHPAFGEIFSGYYSRSAQALAERGGTVAWTRTGEAVYREQDFPVLYAGIERLVDPQALRHLLFKARKPVPLADILSAQAGAHTPAAEREAFLVLWALKHDLLEIEQGA